MLSDGVATTSGEGKHMQDWVSFYTEDVASKHSDKLLRIQISHILTNIED